MQWMAQSLRQITLINDGLYICFMTQAMTNSRIGRLLLHTICAFRDHHWGWHWRGIIREVCSS